MKHNLVFVSGLLSLTIIALVGISSVNQVSALTEANGTIPTVLASNEIKNNPMAMKILKNIEISKQRISQIEKNKKDLQLIEEKRTIAKNLEEQALQSLQMRTQVNSSKNSYDRFLATVQNNNTKKVFSGQFDLMNNKVNLGHIAMKTIFDNRGSWEQAMKMFSKYAEMKRNEMVQTNKNLNLQYGLSDPVIQASFDKSGLLPDDFIKVPTVVLPHQK